MSKKILQDPAFRRVVAVAGLLAIVALVDDVVMIASFWADGNHWSVAGRSLVLVLVGGLIAIIWRAAQKDLGDLEARAGKELEETEKIKPCSVHEGMGIHPELVAWEERGEDGEIRYSGCMVCRFESLTDRVTWLERRDHGPPA